MLLLNVCSVIWRVSFIKVVLLNVHLLLSIYHKSYINFVYCMMCSFVSDEQYFAVFSLKVENVALLIDA